MTYLTPRSSFSVAKASYCPFSTLLAVLVSPGANWDGPQTVRVMWAGLGSIGVGAGEGVVGRVVVETRDGVALPLGSLGVGGAAKLHPVNAATSSATRMSRMVASGRRRTSACRDIPLPYGVWCLARSRGELPHYTRTAPTLHLPDARPVLVLTTAMGYDLV